MDKNPDDALALFLMGSIYAEAERFGAAINMFRLVTSIKPEKPEGWNNLGMAYDSNKMHDKAMECFQKSWSIGQTAQVASNIGNAYLNKHDYQNAKTWAKRALKIDPNLKGAHSVLGMASLSTGDWATGWDNYEYSIGSKFRTEVQYQEEDRWDGTPGKTVIVYGEQGLGDEIMYASCVPDAAKENTIVLECDKRLEGLYRRSFPDVHVYGTRRDPAYWIDDHKLDARCAVGTLPKFYRRKLSDFPGTPYLKADPERVAQWKTLFKRKTIGIAWSGGSKHNKPEARAIGLEAFRPLIEAIDADFVSLQYQDPTDEIKASGLPVKHWKRATLTDDYDDTAGLVAALDMVIGVNTSVQHLAGALGVPGVVLVPNDPLWIWSGDFPWYKSARLFRQKKGESWAETVKRLHDTDFCGLRSA